MQAMQQMAIVPFRVSGAAADQTMEHRLFQIGHHTLRIDQDVYSSASLQDGGMQQRVKASGELEAHSLMLGC